MDEKKRLTETISRNFEDGGEPVLPLAYTGQRKRKNFRQRHPDFPLWLSIIALALSIAMPIVRGFLGGKP